MNDLSPRRQQLLTELAPAVKRHAWRLSRRYPGQMADDLNSVGIIAALEMLAAWDEEAPYAAYVMHRARGAMLDEIRRCRWAPRTVGERARNLELARHGLAQRLGREPEGPELRQALGMDASAFARYRSLGVVRHQEDAEVLDRVGSANDNAAWERLQDRERCETVRQAIARLPGREAWIVARTCLEGEPLKGLAQELGVTESRISQLRSRAFKRLAHDEALQMAA